MLKIDGDRLLADLRKLAEFGQYKTGVDRIAFSKQDVAARRWLQGRLAEAGLEARIDRHGNVLGSWPGADRAILVGSHSDTVPKGGWLDGALGVIYGLEIARALRESDPDRTVGIDVISFQDEEGTYLPCLGSKGFCGLLNEGDIEAAVATGGARLADAIASAGLEGDPLRMAEGRYVGFLEAHIEQGPRLENTGARIGVVESFVGIRRMNIEARGRADHAGTTPMSMRQDAAVPLFRLGAWVAERMPGLGGPDTVWNIGNMILEPGAANVVPARAQLTLEFRDSDAATLDRIEAAVMERIEAVRRQSGLPLTATVTARIPPARTDAGLCEALAWSARENGEAPTRMPSGAGHDCMITARVMPSAMLFVPSIGGRSHDIEENTSEEDIILGCQVLANAVEKVIVGNAPPAGKVV